MNSIIFARVSSKCFSLVVLGWFEGLSQKFLSSSASKMLLLAGHLLCYLLLLIFTMQHYAANLRYEVL